MSEDEYTSSEEDEEEEEDDYKIPMICLNKPLPTVNGDCTICMEEGKVITTLCNHHFHENCLEQWLRKSRTCPMCRKSYPLFP
jgi:hypothetical protein